MRESGRKKCKLSKITNHLCIAKTAISINHDSEVDYFQVDNFPLFSSVETGMKYDNWLGLAENWFFIGQLCGFSGGNFFVRFCSIKKLIYTLGSLKRFRLEA